LYHGDSYERLGSLEGHEGEVLQVTFNHAGDLLVSASWDGTTRLWDVKALRPLVRTRFHPLGTLQFSPDDQRLACGRDHGSKLWLWEVADGRECRTLE